MLLTEPVWSNELLTNRDLNPYIKDKISIYQTAISDNEEEEFLSVREQDGASSTSILLRKRDSKKKHLKFEPRH